MLWSSSNSNCLSQCSEYRWMMLIAYLRGELRVFFLIICIWLAIFGVYCGAFSSWWWEISNPGFENQMLPVSHPQTHCTLLWNQWSACTMKIVSLLFCCWSSLSSWRIPSIFIPTLPSPFWNEWCHAEGKRIFWETHRWGFCFCSWSAPCWERVMMAIFMNQVNSRWEVFLLIQFWGDSSFLEFGVEVLARFLIISAHSHSFHFIQSTFHC